MAASLQMMNDWQQATLAEWARQQNNDRLAVLWKQLTAAISYYKPEVDNLDVANAIAARLETIRIEIENRRGVREEMLEPSPWYKSVDDRASWTLTDFTKLPADFELCTPTDGTVIEKQDRPLDLLLQPLHTAETTDWRIRLTGHKTLSIYSST